jgi:hypothetical protein
VQLLRAATWQQKRKSFAGLEIIVVELRDSVFNRFRRMSVVVVLVLIAVALVWAAQRRNGVVEAANCSALYRAARTATDSARVDAARPSLGGRDEAAVATCGEVRLQQRSP